ncbi:hypothetical protein DRN69_01325 [Candidatus Pacearchaeota archaeon]|nr:MAG: hypothetical protein DRN69_01325 [Candidatus Pacearchaeota archaeon]
MFKRYMPINAHPDYLAAEKEYLLTQTLEEKLRALEKMISLVPKHKGAENLRAQLRTRYKKLKEQLAKSKKSRKKKGQGIKKEEMQAVIIGMTNTGKSSLLSLLTNVNPEIADYEFTTKNPIIGIMKYSGVNIQIIEIPAFESEFYDKGLVNTADVILILITKLEQIKEIEEDLEKAQGKRIIVFNKSDILNQDQKRKISATLSSKKYNFILTSIKTKEGIESLKDKIFQSFEKIRVYTKEPGKGTDKERPIVLDKDATVKDVAEKILHGFFKSN